MTDIAGLIERVKGATNRGREYWLEQADLAESYANARPVADIRGYVEAMCDAWRFKALASSLPSDKVKL